MCHVPIVRHQSGGNLIQQHPIQAELPDRFGELGKVDRLEDVAVHTEIVTLDQITEAVRQLGLYWMLLNQVPPD